MAEIQTSSWSETAASNNSSPPDGWPENMARRSVNDTAREMAAAIKREWNRSHPTVTSGGTATAITLTYTTAPPAYAAGLMFAFICGTTCGDNPTLNVNALGAKKLYRNGDTGPQQMAADDMIAGNAYMVAYNTSLDSGSGGFIAFGSFDRGALPNTPVGTLVAYAGSSAPTGYLLCDGSAVSRATFANLFTAIGTTFGVGDGSTTFNLPDLRGRSIFGKDNMGGSAANRVTSGSGFSGTTLGATGGSEYLQTHTHTGAVSITDPGHGHSIGGSLVQGGGTGVGGSGTGQLGGSVSSNTTGITASLSIDSSGNGSSQNMPPAMILNWLICYANVAGSGTSGGGTVTSVNASSSVGGLTFTGGPVVASGTLDLSLSSAGSFRAAIGLPNTLTGTAAYSLRVKSDVSGFEAVQRGFYITPYWGGTMANAEILYELELPTAWSIPALSSGNHGCKASTAATGSTTLTIKKNGSSIGTFVFAAASTTAAVSFSGAVSFAANDKFTIEGPATADTTLANTRAWLTALWG